MFEKFGDYMFSLLPSPLQRKKHTNQFRIFFAVIGEVFDGLKQDIFRLRRETNIRTCSAALLYIYAAERDMPRLKGESEENFRKRLQMKWEVAQLAGSQAGIKCALQMIGYSDCDIVPLYITDAARWAEITIIFPTDIDRDYTVDFAAIRNEVMKVKRASTLPHYLFRYQAYIPTIEHITNRIICRFTVPVYGGIRYLDGTWRLDGSQNLDTIIKSIPGVAGFRFRIPTQERIGGSIITSHNVWKIDGTYTLNGSKRVDAYIREDKL